MVELLLLLGANHAIKDDRGNTPLNDASAKTDKQIVNLLVAAGANPKEQGLNRFEGAVPILSVKSVPTSIAYYVEKLGIHQRVGLGLTTDLRLCPARSGPRIFLCQGAQGSPGTWLSIFVHDVNDLYGDYQATRRDHPSAANQFSLGRTRDERRRPRRTSAAHRQRRDRSGRQHIAQRSVMRGTNPPYWNALSRLDLCPMPPWRRRWAGRRGRRRAR